MSETAPGAEERRLPRRFLLASGAAAAVGVTDVLVSTPAEAAAGTTAWLLGGNTGVNTDGSNFLGPTNVAPLVFKTKPSTTGALAERMRITPTGSIGVGIISPAARVHVKAPPTVVEALRSNSTNTTGDAIGVQGIADSGTGVVGTSATNTGVKGNGGAYGVVGYGGVYGSYSSATGSGSVGSYASGASYGVLGYGSTYGVYGSGADGVHGSGTTNGVYGTGSTTGVYGYGFASTGVGVSGHGGQYGVTGSDGTTAGVRGDSGYVGVWGAGTSWGMYGEATGTSGQNYGVYGKTDSASGYGLFSAGNAHVNGTLSKTAGSFKIDHPLDPERRWLSHSFVESPDMMNVYNGNVTLDGEGRATVRLPSYFTALNKDFRYQLTAIGGPARDLHVSREVKRNAFKIAGGTPNGRVSWQVTGIRQDDYAREHPIVVETPKSAVERGTRSFVPAGSSAKAFVPAPAGAPLPKAHEPQKVVLPAVPKGVRSPH